MRVVPPVSVHSLDTDAPLHIINYCPETVYPGITTQSGEGPPESGFKLDPGASYNQTVSSAWQGRVWGRTNCTFNDDGTASMNIGGFNGGGKACGTGDCNGIVNCRVTGDTPVTLAEFTYNSGDGQTYYDISLVDGYNLPMAVILLSRNNASLTDIPPNLTNPSCQGTSALLAPDNFSPYDTSQEFLGTNNTYPLPFDNDLSTSDVSSWCPWNLQLNPPTKPGDGVYPYPDDDIARPLFSPCYSACAKWNLEQDCCTGSYDSPDSCSPSEYSDAAKKVCPDAYSFAFDDQDSTFIVPAGAGFAVVFCPGARSTNILQTKAAALQQLADSGHVGIEFKNINLNITRKNAAHSKNDALWSWRGAFVLTVAILIASGV